MRNINYICGRQALKKITLGLSACFVGTTLMAASASFSVTATADNDFIIVHSQGNSRNVVYRSQDGRNWKKAQTAKFTINVKTLRHCSIDIIAWNDHSVTQGLAAVVRGNRGQVHSGNPQMGSYATKVPNQARWANNNYPNNSQINSIMNSLIPNNTHNLGVVGSAQPWGNAVSGLSSPTKWIWASDARMGKPYGKNFTVYRTSCAKVAKLTSGGGNKKGMTWRKRGVDGITGVVHVGCDYDGGKGGCNPYKGDTMCTTALPMLCKKDMSLPKPASVHIPNQNNQWSGNIVGTTKPVAPANSGITTKTKANQYCQAEFGSGWKVAGFHDGRQWNFKAYGNIGTKVEGKRFWVNIRDQANGNCWTQQ